MAEDPGDALRLGSMPLELDRLDDAPSLEKWVCEMVRACPAALLLRACFDSN